MSEPIKFLIVDDIAENIVALEALLRRDGLQIHSALSGRQALELLLVNDYALALIDVNMPEMDGFELAELMRGVERLRQVPIIFVTAGSRESKRMFRGFESGAVDFLYKPVDPLILRNKADVFYQLSLQRQQLAEQARRAQESEALLRTVLDATSALIYVKDVNGRFVLCNRALEALFGYPPGGLVGRSDHDLLLANEVDGVLGNDARVLASEGVIDVEESTAVHGQLRTYISSKVAMRDASGEVWGVCGISTDISEQKRLSEDLERAVRTREDILAIVSHDLRNPLNVIGVTADMLRMQADRENDARLRSQAQLLRRSVAHMDRLIRDLLDMASLRAGRLSIQADVHDLQRIVDEAMSTQSVAAQLKVIDLESDVQTGEIQLFCDGDRIQQVLANLIGNAIKFSTEGTRVWLRVTPVDDGVQFSIVDSGPGIRPEDESHLFDPYWSGDQNKRGGVGLGLYIARGIVEAHGGRIWSEQTPHGGAALCFVLPCKSAG